MFWIGLGLACIGFGLFFIGVGIESGSTIISEAIQNIFGDNKK